MGKENRAIHPDHSSGSISSRMQRKQKNREIMTPLIYGISYRATAPARRIRKMYMGIFALLYYIIMGIQSEPLKTGKDDELKSRTDG